VALLALPVVCLVCFPTSIAAASLAANATPVNYQHPVPKCDQFPGATAGRKILACVEAAAGGGIADATGFTGAQTFDVDLFAGVASGVKLVLGSFTATSSAEWVIPSNSDVSGVGASTVIAFTAPPGWVPAKAYVRGNQIKVTSVGGNRIVEEQQNAICTSGAKAQPTWNESEAPIRDGSCSWLAKDFSNLVFINGGLHPWAYSTAGGVAATSINLHDMTIDGGSSASYTCVGFRALRNSNIYNLFVQNCNGPGTSNGVDLRDVTAISVHDNVLTNDGNEQGHALGGGTNSAAAQCSFCGIFREVKIYANHVVGGNGDGIDYSGINGIGAKCDNNDISGNTVDHSRYQAIFNETCGHTVISHNVIRNSGRAGIYVNTGVGGQKSNGVTVADNVIATVGHESLTNGGGIVIAASDRNIVTGNTIELSQDHGINLENSSFCVISGNKIAAVSLNARSTYSGVFINSTAFGSSVHNMITGNSIQGGDTQMLYGIEYRSASFGRSSWNLSSSNVVNGGSAGNVGGVATTPVHVDSNSTGNWSVYDQFSTNGNKATEPSVQHN
jgi:parallel beta-helix repeat protein